MSGAARRRAQHEAAAGRRRSGIRWAATAVALIGALVVVLVTLPSAEDDSARAGARATLGSPAPDIEMADFDGTIFALRDYRGTPVVLNFWASWCPFCIAEMPDFERVHQDIGSDVVFVGVNLQDDRAQAERLLEATGVTYRIAADTRGVIYGAFGGTAMPTTVFIDAEGTVRETVAGQMSEQQLRAAIDRNFEIAT